MKTTTFFALSAALFGLAAAAPVHKRDVVVQTVTSEVVTTVEITTTIWVDPPTSTPSPDVEPAEFFESPAPTPEEETPTPSSSSSPEAAPPAPSSTEAPSVPSPEAPAPPATTQAPVVEQPAPEPQPQPEPEPEPEPTPEPQPQPQPQPQPEPQPQPQPQPEAPSTGGGSGQYSGDMTHYTPGLGACGVTNTDNDLIVAVSYKLFDPKTPNNNPNKNPLCNQKINIFYEGNSMEATITDRCAGCEIEGSLDMTQAMFNKITNGKGDGRVTTGMSWSFA